MFNPLPANYSPNARRREVESYTKLIVGVLFQVIDPINKLIDTVEFDAVFYSLDWHPADHVSFIDNIKQRPIHPTSPVSTNYYYDGNRRLHNKSTLSFSLVTR